MKTMKFKGSLKFLIDTYHVSEESVMESIEKFKKKISDGMVLGHIGPRYNLNTALSDSSHIVKSFQLNDDLTYDVDIEPLNTPMGQIFQTVLSVSSELQPNIICIVTDYCIDIITVDLEQKH